MPPTNPKPRLVPGYEFAEAGPRPRTDLEAHGLELEAPAEWVMAVLGKRGKCTVNLQEGERAWNPTSTKRMLYGPALVDYVLHPDGGVTATVRDHA